MRNRRPRHDRGGPASLPPAGHQVPADADLGVRLERALRDGLGGDHVDVAQLLRDTRQATTRRTRVRRVTMIAAAAVAVGAVPVGLQTARWMSPPPVTAGTGSTPVSPPTTAPPPTSARPSPTPTRTAAELPPALSRDPRKVMYKIPDALAFSRTDLGRPMAELYDSGQYRRIPTVSGQACNEGRFDSMDQPIAGRQWSWAEEKSNRQTQLAIDLTVTGWASEKSAIAQLEAVRLDAGACRFGDPLKERVASDTEWLAISIRGDGWAQGHAVQLIPGGLLVAVTVSSPDGSEVATQVASKLVDLATRNAESSGLTKRAVRIGLAAGALPGVEGRPASAGPADTVSPDPSATTP